MILITVLVKSLNFGKSGNRVTPMKKILVMKLGFIVKCEAESNKYATDNQSSVLLKSVLSIGL